MTVSNSAVRHEAARCRFSLDREGHQAELDYTLAGDVMTITHTGVPQQIGRRGVAGELMKAAVDTARQAGWKIVPACSYAAAYLAKHPEEAALLHQDGLLDEALDESFPASDPPSIGQSS